MRTPAALLMALWVAALATGCAANPVSGPPSPAGTPSVASATTLPTSSSTGAGEYRDPNGWTREEIKALYGLDDPPTVAPMRTPAPEERSALINECMLEQGYPPGEDGGWSVPKEQHDALMLASYICDSRYPLEPGPGPLNEDQRIRLFHYWADVRTPCLRELGFDIPDPPTLEVWLSGAQEWAPQYYLGTGGPTDEEVSAACPDEPDNLWTE